MLVTVVLGLTGCSDSGGGTGVATAGGAGSGRATSSPQPQASKDPKDALVDFARCMREQGIEMPDHGDEGVARIDPGDAGAEKVRAAQEKCKHLQPGLEPDGQPDPAMQDRMLKFARCMREHGVAMPDPGAGGQITVPGGPGGPDAKFKAAEEKCRQFFGEPTSTGAPS